MEMDDGVLAQTTRDEARKNYPPPRAGSGTTSGFPAADSELESHAGWNSLR